MSRKAREDKSSWKTPSIYAFAGDYGPYKAKGFVPIANVLVVLHHSPENGMQALAGQAQEVLLKQEASPAILILDVGALFDSPAAFQTALDKELQEPLLTKGFGKSLLRLFQRLLLQNVVLAAEGQLCALALKLHSESVRTDPEMIQKLVLIHPVLSPKFINTHMAGHKAKSSTPLQLVVSPKFKSSRIELLRHFFPPLTVHQVTDESGTPFLIAASTPNAFSTQATNDYTHDYDPDYCNDMGKSLFLSQMTVEMNKYTKQYERNCEDITASLLKVEVEPEPDEATTTTTDYLTCPQYIGALVLRGNRCVLVRSLQHKWTGMKLPFLLPNPNESPLDTAVRAVVEFTGVDAAEVTPLPRVLPVSVYPPQGYIHLYPLYATEPPPDGPLEDADLEDDETSYDWYTYENAIAKLDAASIAALQTMALNLVQAANAGLVPAKWGGVFGQELSINATTTTSTTTTAPSSILKTEVEEWHPTRQGDVLQDVRKANNTLLGQQLASSKTKTGVLPVTLLSGFLGSGKTTLLTHILKNYDGLKVAILVNDMGELNIDAALVQSTTSIRQKEEHMVELSNGCICCTLREDLLVEVAAIASEGTFDYLLIESSGISEPLPVAETFTFEDSTGLRLDHVAQIDTLVTVVDGSRFLAELDSLESLQSRNWQADPEDQRTISHLLCDQVEFANVIVLNKCDLMTASQRDKVQRLIHTMNPTAKLVESTFSQVPLDTVLGTGLFSMSEAEKHENWLKEARIGEHTPETEEYGIGSFTYRAIKPFLPHKLGAVLDAILDGSMMPFDKSTVLRSKGFVWLANCPQLQGNFSLAGNHYSLVPGNPWWAEIDKSHWPENLERDIAPLWHEPYGDRQQEIVIIGQTLDREAITEALNGCLVSDEEMAQGPDTWNAICAESGDPFQETWDAAIELAKKEGHSHDHEHAVGDNGHGHDHNHDHAQAGGDNGHGHDHSHDHSHTGIMISSNA